MRCFVSFLRSNERLFSALPRNNFIVELGNYRCSVYARRMPWESGVQVNCTLAHECYTSIVRSLMCTTQLYARVLRLYCTLACVYISIVRSLVCTPQLYARSSVHLICIILLTCLWLASYNICTLARVHNMCTSVYVCATCYIEDGDPTKARRTKPRRQNRANKSAQ